MRKTKIIISLLALGLAMSLPTVVLAIGQMTEPIVIANAIKGGEFEETMVIVNTEKVDLNIGLSAEGDIGTWAKFYNPTDLTTPIESIFAKAGENKNVTVVFTVPSDTPNGEYKGFVSAARIADDQKNKEGDSSTSVKQKIDREVTITVSDQEIISAEVSIIPNKYDFAVNEPMSIRFLYFNTGNIQIKPQVQVKIKDIDQTKVISSTIYPYPENEPAVKPLARHEIPALEIPTNSLGQGRYWIEFTVTDKDQTLLEKQFRFTVGRPGTILGIAFGDSAQLLPMFITIGGIIGILILTALVAIAYQLYQKNKKLSKKYQKPTLKKML